MRPDTQYSHISFDLSPTSYKKALINAAAEARTYGQMRCAVRLIEEEFGIEVDQHSLTVAMRSADFRHWTPRDSQLLLDG